MIQHTSLPDQAGPLPRPSTTAIIEFVPRLDVEVDALVDRVLSGEVRAAARACRLVDDRTATGRELVRRLHGSAQSARLIGLTGSPGAGKSSLTDELVARLRVRGERVGVIAVDPTSPFSGGAILGDRIRMQRHFEDPEVFIRSVATRGALGGLSRSTADLAVVLGAWGASTVLIETVGVGQDELDVTRLADTTVVVVAPGFGDDIQAIKAGILECADVFAVNKADRPGADATAADLEAMLSLAAPAPPRGGGHGVAKAAHRTAPMEATTSWRPPIVRCSATQAQGIDDLVEALARHQEFVEARLKDEGGASPWCESGLSRYCARN